MAGFSVLSWNAQGIRHYAKTDFEKILPFLHSCASDVICLQEMPEAKSKLAFLEKLEQYTSFIPKYNNPPSFGGNHNHNIILSRFPIEKSGEITFPEIINKQKLEGAIWADISINKIRLRIYNCHFGLFGFGFVERIRQLEIILKHALKFDGSTIICGDMNTTIPRHGLPRKIVQWFYKIPPGSMRYHNDYFEEDERYAFAGKAQEYGFTEAADIKKPTWSLPYINYELFNLKLDWFLIKYVQVNDICLGPYISDHRPISAECFLKINKHL
ncbi:MAG: endonuclease/exonuclease/phosphatase family protein [Nanoarchaeota archaeon]